MAARPTTLLIAAGTTALLVALVLLWQSTRAETATPAERGPATPAAPGESTASTATSPSAPDTQRAARPTTTGGFAGARPAPSMPAPAPAAEQLGGPVLTNEGLDYGGKQLREQTAAVEPLVRECIEKAAVAGQHPTGTAMLTYHVAKRGEELAIENTGVDNEKTTIDNEPLLECLHRTATAMKFVGLPRGAQEIYAARRVTLENGKITEYKHVTFSYLR